MPTSAAMRRLVPYLILLAGLAVRLAGLTTQSLWRDEVDAMRFAADGAVLSLAQPGWNGPLYTLLLAPWIDLSGRSEFALRFSSLLPGVALLAIVYRLGRRLAGERMGLTAMALAALSPYLVWYSQELKMYALLAALGAASFALLAAALDRGGGGRWAAYVAVTGAMPYVHIMGALLLPAQAVILAARRRHLERRWAGAAALAVLTLPYLPLAAWQAPLLLSAFQTGHPYYPPAEALGMLARVWPLGILAGGGPWLLLPFAAAAIAALWPGRTGRRDGERPSNEFGAVGPTAGRRPGRLEHESAKRREKRERLGGRWGLWAAGGACVAQPTESAQSTRSTPPASRSETRSSEADCCLPTAITRRQPFASFRGVSVLVRMMVDRLAGTRLEVGAMGPAANRRPAPTTELLQCGASSSACGRAPAEPPHPRVRTPHDSLSSAQADDWPQAPQPRIHSRVSLPPRLTLVAWLALPVLLVQAISLRSPVFTDRYLIASAPALLLLLALGVERVARWRRPAAVALLALMLAAGGVGLVRQGSYAIKADTRAAAAIVSQGWRDGDVLLLQIPYMRHSMAHYLGPLYPMLDGPFTNGGMMAEQVDLYLRIQLARHERVWLLLSEAEMWDERGLTLRWLRDHGTPQGEWHLARVALYLVELPAAE